MSFSSEVKSELKTIVPESRHCQIAELAAFRDLLRVAERAVELNDLLFTLYKRAFNIGVDVHTNGKRTLDEALFGNEDVKAALTHGSVLRLDCCRRAYLRGAFLAAGSVSSPEKAYHLEILAPTEEKAEKIRSVMLKEGLDSRIVLRKKDYVVYLKEADQIVTLLGAMGANISFLNLESIRVMKDMRGRVNRSVNCETANLDRVINSAVRQCEDIRLIAEVKGLTTLSPTLREMAELRLRYPEASFSELGKMTEPRIGKSGVHHRLRKLGAIAQELREDNTNRD